MTELVQAAFARDSIEAEMIQGLLEGAGIPSLLEQAGLNVDGPQLGFGLLPRGFAGGPQRVMVHAERVEEARALLAETMVEVEPDQEEEWPEIANARNLGEAARRKPRNYGVVGAYTRAYLWAFGAFALMIGIFFLSRLG